MTRMGESGIDTSLDRIEEFANSVPHYFSMARLKSRLSQFMIRRTHRDKLFNARLLVLPPPSEDTRWLEFNEIERAVYEIVKARFISRINCISRSGELEKSYKYGGILES